MGGGGAPLKSHLFIQIYRELRGTRGTPLHPPCATEGQEKATSPTGVWGAALGGVLGGGRGGHLPRGHHQLPRQLLALAALGSVWRAVLRELEGRGFTGRALGRARPAPPRRTAQPTAGSRAPADPEQGHRGLLLAQLPPGSREVERRGQGFEERTWHLLASWKS